MNDYTWNPLDARRQEIMLATLEELATYHDNAAEEANDLLASCDSTWSDDYRTLSRAMDLHIAKADAFRSAIVAYKREG